MRVACVLPALDEQEAALSASVRAIRVFLAREEGALAEWIAQDPARAWLCRAQSAGERFRAVQPRADMPNDDGDEAMVVAAATPASSSRRIPLRTLTKWVLPNPPLNSTASNPICCMEATTCNPSSSVRPPSNPSIIPNLIKTG